MNIVSLSGGKDSVALWLWALRTGLDPIAVYQDTGWEWDGHYAHLDLLEARVGKIHRCSAPMTFEAQVAKKQMFPRAGYGGQGGQWCTRELKLVPFRNWLRAYRLQHDILAPDVSILLGIRREESEKKHLIASGMPEAEAGPSVVPIGIDAVMEWAKTSRGGKQVALVRTPSGCARWGVCEPAPAATT